MTVYKIIVLAMSPVSAKAELVAWLDQNKATYQRLLVGSETDGADDLIMDCIRGDGGKLKYQYRIRQSLLDE